tara:strand:+ start:10886 stop:11548 length:663 start_codon:yes stop_codon:yes gene_type:complete
MEEFGFNKIDEDDIFDKKSDMNSLYEIQSMQNQSIDISVDDINIQSTIPDITVPDDPTEKVIETNADAPNLSDVVMMEGQNNPLPNELDPQDGVVNPLPNELDIQDGKVNPLPKSIELEDPPVNKSPTMSNPLENLNTEDSLTTRTSKNLQANNRLTFDLQNSNYTPSTPSKPSPVEQTLNKSPARDNIDFEIESSTASNASAKRASRKKARPDWRARHG